MVASDNDGRIPTLSLVQVRFLQQLLTIKLLTMCNYSYTLLKISWRLFDKHYTKLTDEQKSKVRDIYDDFY